MIQSPLNFDPNCIFGYMIFCALRHNTAFFMRCQTGDFSPETGEFLYGILILFVGIRLDLPKCWERKRTPDSGGVSADFRCQKARSHGDCGGGLGILFSVNFRQFRSLVPHSKSGSLHGLVGSNPTASARKRQTCFKLGLSLLLS